MCVDTHGNVNDLFCLHFIAEWMIAERDPGVGFPEYTESDGN